MASRFLFWGPCICVFACGTESGKGPLRATEAGALEGGSIDATDASTVDDRAGSDEGSCGPAQGVASIVVDATEVVRTIPPTLYGANVEWIYDADKLWNTAGSAPGFDSDEVALMGTIGVGPIRFPGGIYADNYDWTNGVTGLAAQPRTSLVPTVVDTGEFPNPVGTDEVVNLLRELGAPMPVFQTATVAAAGYSNTSQGGITGLSNLAASWVHYCNDASNAVRAGNGHPESYGVKYWELGNEPYWRTKDQIAPDTYGQIVRSFSAAMKAADPSVQLIAAACQNPDELSPLWSADHDYWNDALLQIAMEAQAAHQAIAFDLLAFHNAYAPQVDMDLGSATFEQVYQTLWAYPVEFAEYFASLEAKWKAALGGTFPVRIAVTEWGPLFSFTPASPWFDHGRTLGSAIYVASALEAFIRDANIEVATYFKLSDPVQLGLTTDPEVASTGGVNPGGMQKAVAYVFELFHRHFGTTLVSTTVPSSPTYAVVQAGSNPLPSNPSAIATLDVVSSLSDDGKKLYVLVTNKSLPNAGPVTTVIHIHGFAPQPRAIAWTVTGANIDANDGPDIDPSLGIMPAPQISAPTNPQFNAGAPGKVVIMSSPINACSTFVYSFPPISVTSIELTQAP